MAIIFFLIPMALFMLTFIAGSIITAFSGNKCISELVQADLSTSLATKLFTACLVIFMGIAVIAGLMGIEPKSGMFLVEVSKYSFFGMIAASWYWLYECYREGVYGKIVQLLKN